MRLPDPVLEGVRGALAEGDAAAPRIVEVVPVGGGCINPSARVTTDDGRACFVKWNTDASGGLFEVEARGLRALGACGALRVPEVLGAGGGGPGSPGWLLLELVEAGPEGPGYAEELGRGLASLHRRGARDAARLLGGDPEAWGWEEDNYIGSLPQPNGPTGGWAAFWRDRRIAPQLERARRGGFFSGGEGFLLDDVVARMEPVLAAAETDGPSLLHGDLWGGNVMSDREGAPVLVDPAVFRGHREVDLAMSELFGGFPARFLDAYREAWPLAEGYASVRRHLYQLYYLLVHVNLFGASYVERTAAVARRARARM